MNLAQKSKRKHFSSSLTGQLLQPPRQPSPLNNDDLNKQRFEIFFRAKRL